VWIDKLLVAVNCQSVAGSKQPTDCVQRSPSKEAAISSTRQGIPLILQTQMFFSLLTKSHHMSICSERPIHSLYPPHCFLNTNFNITVPSSLCIPNCSLPSRIATKNFKKAYDSVRREVLYTILIEFGVPKKLVRLIKMCLPETYSRVRVGKNLSGMFLLGMV